MSCIDDGDLLQINELSIPGVNGGLRAKYDIRNSTYYVLWRSIPGVLIITTPSGSFVLDKMLAKNSSTMARGL